MTAYLPSTNCAELRSLIAGLRAQRAAVGKNAAAREIAGVGLSSGNRLKFVLRHRAPQRLAVGMAQKLLPAEIRGLCRLQRGSGVEHGYLVGIAHGKVKVMRDEEYDAFLVLWPSFSDKVQSTISAASSEPDVDQFTDDQLSDAALLLETI